MHMHASRHRLVLIASPIHRHLALPRPLASKFRAEDSRIAHLSPNNNARIASPVEPHAAEHAVPLHSFVLCMFLPRSFVEEIPLPFPFPFLLSHRTSTFLHLSFSYLADGPCTNAVYALISRAQSRPSIHTRISFNLNNRSFPDYIAVRDCRRLHSSFLFPYHYSPIFVAYLSVLRTSKYHRPAPHRIIRLSRNRGPPFFLYLVCDFSLLFPVRSVPIRCRLLSTNDTIRESVRFPSSLTLTLSRPIPRPSKSHRRSHD